MVMILFANAKINLGLHITGKRPDGYHNLETVLFPIPFYDVIEFNPADKFSLDLYGEKIPGAVEENLILNTYRLLQNRFSLPGIEVHLLKNIPPGSGLGGGSSDAAHLLSGLNQYFDLGMNQGQLRQLAENLGSDCPFFIGNTPMYATGKGEILEPVNIDLTGYFLVLVVPEIRIVTEKAYSLLKEPVSHRFHLREIIEKPLEEWSGLLINDFENVIFSKHPELKEIKNDLMKNGARYAALTGSGSAIFGIYKKRPSIQNRRPLTRYLIFCL